MLQYVDNPFFDEMLNLCKESKRSIKLCAPFVKTSIVEALVKYSNVPVSLITNVNLQSFHSKASDIDALSILLDNNAAVFNCSKLHAKVYIFDDRICFVTSANLTHSGLMQNLERGVISDDPLLLKTVSSDYGKIIEDETVGKVTQENIVKIKNILAGMPISERIKYPDIETTSTYIEELYPITQQLSGWKLDVFEEVNSLSKPVFDSETVAEMAKRLYYKYPHNNNREAKIRQQLQLLRDLGLVEFTQPGIYKRLWAKG